jgi:cell wall-associated NlpC family hydrolase
VPRRSSALSPRPTKICSILLAVLPITASAQRTAFEFHLGHWSGDNPSTTYEFRMSPPSLTHGFVATALVSDSLGRRQAFYGAGYEFTFFRGRRALGPYAIVGAALGASTDTATQQLAILWNIGAGLEWRPVSAVAVGAEVRYRLDDRGPRGFWRAAPDARAGPSIAVGVTLHVGKRRGGGSTSSQTGGSAAPAPALIPPPEVVTGNAASVVETAISVLGVPYQWGGTAENGFDCSGLIQYAYGLHGIRLPRKSRDQAQAGAEVSPVVEALRPGDILLFSSRSGAGVTHVGMYAGEGKFIHSGSSGVKISLLDPHDPDGAYWMARWVGARRLIP